MVAKLKLRTWQEGTVKSGTCGLIRHKTAGSPYPYSMRIDRLAHYIACLPFVLVRRALPFASSWSSVHVGRLLLCSPCLLEGRAALTLAKTEQ